MRLDLPLTLHPCTVRGMTTQMTTPLTLSEVIEALTELDQLDDVGRATSARRLGQSVAQFLAAYADAAVYTATRTDTQPAVAARMGVTLSVVERAVNRHRKATGV